MNLHRAMMLSELLVWQLIRRRHQIQVFPEFPFQHMLDIGNLCWSTYYNYQLYFALRSAFVVASLTQSIVFSKVGLLMSSDKAIDRTNISPLLRLTGVHFFVSKDFCNIYAEFQKKSRDSHFFQDFTSEYARNCHHHQSRK